MSLVEREYNLAASSMGRRCSLRNAVCCVRWTLHVLPCFLTAHLVCLRLRAVASTARPAVYQRHLATTRQYISSVHTHTQHRHCRTRRRRRSRHTSRRIQRRVGPSGRRRVWSSRVLTVLSHDVVFAFTLLRLLLSWSPWSRSSPFSSFLLLPRVPRLRSLPRSSLFLGLAPPVVVRFKSIGSAPVMKNNVFKVTAGNKFQAVVVFLRGQLGIKQSDALVSWLPPVGG